MTDLIINYFLVLIVKQKHSVFLLYNFYFLITLITILDFEPIYN